MKGQVSLIEAITSTIVLFIAFNMIITTGEYQTKWEEALSSLQGRDILITADRSGKFHDYAFSPTTFNSEFLNKIATIKDAIIKIETEGTVKNTVYIACDCTAEQITYLQNILADEKFNTRAVNVVVCSTTIPTINTCGASTTYPNALVIWGYKDLTPHINTLLGFINDGNSIIEIADILNSKVDEVGIDDDEGQKKIFGLKSIAGVFPPPPNLDEFLKPMNSSQLPHQSYKWFYHLPYLLKGTISESVPVEGITPCGTPGMRGEFKFQNVNNRFWICGTSSVYWDTNGNNIADMIVTLRNKFSIGASNFFLNYIDSTDKIRISFKPDYRFNDFVVTSELHNKFAIPIPNNKTRVLLSMGFWDTTKENPRAAIVFNGTENGKTVWMADFSRGGLSNTGDDHKQLLASLMLSIANKRTKETFQQVGQITSYINVNNTDMLEIYKIDLSIGKPF